MTPQAEAIYNKLVNDVALLPDLALAAGEHADGAHLDHGRGEVGEELVPVGARGVAEHVGAGGRVGEQLGVGVEEAPALGHVGVVAQVEGAEAAGVHLDQGGVVVQAGALGAEARHVRAVQLRVGVAGVVQAREVVEAVGEGEAVRRADGVAGRQHRQVPGVQALGAEQLGQLREVARGRRQLVGLVGDGHPAVPPPQRDRPERALAQPHCVPGHESQHVGAGDGVRARLLHRGLDPLDEAEAAQRQVRLRVLLRGVVRRGVEEHRAVAPPDEAVVEVHPEERPGEAGRDGERAHHLLPHDVLHAGARLAVEPLVQLRRRRERREQQRQESRPGRHPRSSELDQRTEKKGRLYCFCFSPSAGLS
uniref:Uncharacterized protein n=1 Tax=Zea mays TaxID=4577 RepID=C4J4D0_MAIZE|nr:unknown [Zea mays]